MTLYDLPAAAVALFGLVFMAAAVFADVLSAWLGSRDLGPGERVLLFLLGLCMTSLWALWYLLV
jgi:hypothetical protein